MYLEGGGGGVLGEAQSLGEGAVVLMSGTVVLMGVTVFVKV